MLVARPGLTSQQGSTPVTEVELGRFRIRLTPSGARREMDVWHAGTGGGAKVLSLWWSGEDFTVVGFRRGPWEQELLALDGRGVFPPLAYALSEMFKLFHFGLILGREDSRKVR